jgi:O-antigen/teichoic acid export membrane protein
LPSSLAARGGLQRLLRSEFFRHGAVVFASTIVVNVFNYLFHFLISRRLGVTGYGTLYSLFAVLSLLGVPTSVLTMIVVRYAAEFRALSDPAHLRALSRWVFARTSLLGAGIVVLGALLAVPIAGYLRIDDARLVFLASVILALSVITPSVRGILQGTEDFGRYSASNIIEGALRAALGVALASVGFGVGGALLGCIIAVVIALGYTLVAVRRHFGSAAPQPLHLDIGRLVRTSAGVTAAAVALAGLGFLDVLLVKHYFPPSEAGLYSAASLVGKVLLFVVSFVPTIVLPKVTARAARGESPVSVIVQAAVCVGVICGTGLLVLSVAPGLVVQLMLGKAYLAAAPLVFPYGCAMALLGATSAIVAYKVGLHRFDFVPPLFAVVVAEVVGISLFHTSLIQVIGILLVGNSLALVATLYRISDHVLHPVHAGKAA